MKKLIALILALVCVLSLVGCNNRSMNYIISNEPSITGIVKETNENATLIENTEADKVWNEQHFGGAKSVVITGADVKVRATFYCDLIDTTTRQSLL